MTAIALLNSERQSESDDLGEIVSEALKATLKFGASAASVSASRSQNSEVKVRMGQIETVENGNQKSLAIAVFLGQHRGLATTNDLSRKAIEDTVRAACAIAKHTAEDPCNGLPPLDRLVQDTQDLELFHANDIDRDRALQMALECEATALESDAAIENSEGASFSGGLGESALGNSEGLLISEKSSTYSIGCSVIAKTDSGMQGDYWYSSARDLAMLDSPDSVGRKAAARTVRKLDPKRIKTCAAPVLFEAPVAGSLLSALINAISGPSQYRKSTFLLDSAGEKIFPDWVRIHEQPHLKGALGSSIADAEGVATQAQDIVTDGVLQRYVLDCYSARKLKLSTTANAGGTFNLTIDSGSRNFADLVRLMDRGLVVTELMGFGTNIVTGDYSVGACGLWVENGEIQYPVAELTIAGNLRQIFRNFVDVGADCELQRRTRTGSILISEMAIAGE